MKSKPMTYFLGFMVVMVWGIIIYRIFTAAGGNDDNLPVASIKPAKELYNDFDVPKDTTRLLLNYRDPFGLIKQKDTEHMPVRKMISKKTLTGALTPPQAFNWGFIKYSGYVHNPDSKKLVTLLSINGQNVTLSEGETKAQVQLLKNMRDSVKISFDGKIKFITINR